MPAVTIKESRKLVLPLETVIEALLHFDRKSHGPLSRGDVLEGAPVHDDAGEGIDVAVRMADQAIEWHRFDLDTVAAAIISYCRAKRIPLPYSGVKSLALTRDGITFNIENTVSIAQRPAVAADIAGRPLRYAKGYEPHSILPLTQNETYV